VCPYPKEEKDTPQNVMCVGIQNQSMGAEFYRKGLNILSTKN